MRLNIFSALTASFLLTHSIAFAQADAAVPNTNMTSDISYLGPERAEKMDAYLPSPDFKRPVPAVLLIHGGGWRIGDKASGREKNIAKALAEEGYAVFSINYLLNGSEINEKKQVKLTTIVWPQNFYDCKSALRYLRANASRFGIDPARIAVMGGSAGAHLALLLGATANSEKMNQGGLYTNESNAIACIVDFYGPFDIQDKWISSFAGATREESLKNVEAASPVNYFDKNLPPVLIIHGTADTSVPVQVSRDLVKVLDELGVEHTYIEVPDAPHSFGLRVKDTDLRPAIVSFLKKHLGDPARATVTP